MGGVVVAGYTLSFLGTFFFKEDFNYFFIVPHNKGISTEVFWNAGVDWILINFFRQTPEFLQSIAAIWLILVALTIFAEVTFRNFGLFLGADQIVQNSVPAIVFLQVPFAIASGSMLRTTLIFDFFQEKGKKIINSLSYIIGALLFAGIAIGGWTDMIKGWEIGEYQGIGAIEFPVYPIRTVIIFSSIIIVFIYLTFKLPW